MTKGRPIVDARGQRLGTLVPLGHAPRRDRPPLESAIVHDILQAFARMEDVVVWRNNTGMLTTPTGRKMAFGLCEGSSDLIGIVRRNAAAFLRSGDPDAFVHHSSAFGRPAPFGMFFALEVKQPGKKPTEAQARYLEVVRQFGGAAGWCDSVDGAVAFIARVRDGCNA